MKNSYIFLSILVALGVNNLFASQAGDRARRAFILSRNFGPIREVMHGADFPLNVKKITLAEAKIKMTQIEKANEIMVKKLQLLDPAITPEDRLRIRQEIPAMTADLQLLKSQECAFTNAVMLFVANSTICQSVMKEKRHIEGVLDDLNAGRSSDAMMLGMIGAHFGDPSNLAHQRIIAETRFLEAEAAVVSHTAQMTALYQQLNANITRIKAMIDAMPGYSAFNDDELFGEFALPGQD